MAKKQWSKVVQESGIQVRLYRRSGGGFIYREIRLGGRKDRKSLGHSDARLAEEQGRALARSRWTTLGSTTWTRIWLLGAPERSSTTAGELSVLPATGHSEMNFGRSRSPAIGPWVSGRMGGGFWRTIRSVT